MVIKTFINPEGHHITSLVQKLRLFYTRGGFCLLAELHREGSAINGVHRLVFFHNSNGQQNSLCVEFWWEKTEGNLKRANTEPSMHFRRANTEPSMDIRMANTGLI